MHDGTWEGCCLFRTGDKMNVYNQNGDVVISQTYVFTDNWDEVFCVYESALK